METWSLPSRERGLKFLGLDLLRLVLASLPSRERGLKCQKGRTIHAGGQVAPFTGAWIEITSMALTSWSRPRRSLHGSVD